MTVEYLELTNHDPLLEVMVICKAETNYSFSQRRNNSTENQLLFLSSNFARIPVSRSIETRKYKKKIRIGKRLRSS